MNNSHFTQDNLINYFLENRKYFNFNITELNWPKKRGINCFDFETNITLNNQKYIGRGTHENAKTALVIALHELIERYTVNYNFLNSTNGVATHHSLDDAKLGAQSELYERHLILDHIQNFKAFLKLPVSHRYLDNYKDFHFALLQTETYNNFFANALIISSNNSKYSRFLFFSSCNNNINSLLLTALRNLEVLIVKDSLDISNFILFDKIKLLNLSEDYRATKFTRNIKIEYLELTSNIDFPAKTVQAKNTDLLTPNSNLILNPYVKI